MITGDTILIVRNEVGFEVQLRAVDQKDAVFLKYFWIFDGDGGETKEMIASGLGKLAEHIFKEWDQRVAESEGGTVKVNERFNHLSPNPV